MHYRNRNINYSTEFLAYFDGCVMTAKALEKRKLVKWMIISLSFFFFVPCMSHNSLVFDICRNFRTYTPTVSTNDEQESWVLFSSFIIHIFVLWGEKKEKIKHSNPNLPCNSSSVNPFFFTWSCKIKKKTKQNAQFFILMTFNLLSPYVFAQSALIPTSEMTIHIFSTFWFKIFFIENENKLKNKTVLTVLALMIWLFVSKCKWSNKNWTWKCYPKMINCSYLYELLLTRIHFIHSLSAAKFS